MEKAIHQDDTDTRENWFLRTLGVDDSLKNSHTCHCQANIFVQPRLVKDKNRSNNLNSRSTY